MTRPLTNWSISLTSSDAAKLFTVRQVTLQLAPAGMVSGRASLTYKLTDGTFTTRSAINFYVLGLSNSLSLSLSLTHTHNHTRSAP